jgi:hypothetical protein
VEPIVIPRRTLMKLLLSLALLAVFAMPAMAGDDCGGSCPLAGKAGATCNGAACDGALSGFDCQNHCPLAQMANRHRSTGLEAGLRSPLMRAGASRTVAMNLAKI